MTPKRILLLSIDLLFFQGIFYSLAGDFVVSDLFGNDPQVIEDGGSHGGEIVAIRFKYIKLKQSILIF